MTIAIYQINNHGNLKSIGKEFRSYDYDTVEKCAGLFLGDDCRKYVLRTRKLSASKGEYEWNQNVVIVYAACTPNAHEGVLRLMRIGDANTLDGYCFVVTNLREGLCGVFTEREALESFLASKTEEECEDLYVRIVPINTVLV